MEFVGTGDRLINLSTVCFYLDEMCVLLMRTAFISRIQPSTVPLPLQIGEISTKLYIWVEPSLYHGEK